MPLGQLFYLQINHSCISCTAHLFLRTLEKRWKQSVRNHGKMLVHFFQVISQITVTLFGREWQSLTCLFRSRADPAFGRAEAAVRRREARLSPRWQFSCRARPSCPRRRSAHVWGEKKSSREARRCATARVTISRQ